ncbi:putative ABC transporter permease [Candidatus Pacearchaeota archaeon]|jgi:uncharacterized membrane protein|nr:putative ABC transporter permease [Candidatus Pacearchaeota archaeon]
MEPIWNLVIYFAVCAFIGWIIQALSDLIAKRKMTNSGFLYGPFVPVFGFTALAIYFFNLYSMGFPPYFWLIGFFIIPTAIEYFTGYLLETIFVVKLWDYSEYRFNIKGRVSLAVSTLWFLLILLQVFVLQKIIFSGMNQFSEAFRIIVAVSLIIYLGIDFFFSAKVFYYFSKLKKEFGKIDLDKLKEEFSKKVKSISNKIKISPILKEGLRKEEREFIEHWGKDKKDN